MDDPDLVARLAVDVDGAFEALVVAHVDRLYAIAYRLTGHAHDAEEIAQDALVRAYRALSRYEPERIERLALRPWLAAIAVNAARNRRRRQVDRQPPLALAVVDDAALTAPTSSQPEGAAIRTSEREELAGLVAELPERYRVPIVLRYVDDLSFAEIAQLLGRPEGTLKAQVHRGLALLRAAHDAAERQEMTA
jgi:RNA polymerase sigma factor (sigma-70 family)